jgi:hypothetical protein
MSISKDDGSVQPTIDNYEAYRTFISNPNVTTIFNAEDAKLYVQSWYQAFV